MSYSRVPMAGKIKLQCFDKTGTLTNDQLDIEGFQALSVKTKTSTNSSGNRKTGETTDLLGLSGMSDALTG